MDYFASLFEGYLCMMAVMTVMLDTVVMQCKTRHQCCVLGQWGGGLAQLT